MQYDVDKLEQFLREFGPLSLRICGEVLAEIRSLHVQFETANALNTQLQEQLDTMKAYNDGYRKGYHDHILVKGGEGPFIPGMLNYQYFLGNSVGYSLYADRNDLTSQLSAAREEIARLKAELALKEK